MLVSQNKIIILEKKTKVIIYVLVKYRIRNWEKHSKNKFNDLIGGVRERANSLEFKKRWLNW